MRTISTTEANERYNLAERYTARYTRDQAISSAISRSRETGDIQMVFKIENFWRVCSYGHVHFSDTDSPLDVRYILPSGEIVKLS